MRDLNIYASVVGRVALALIFLISGIFKLVSHDMTVGYIASVGLPLPELGYWLAVVVEIGGGIAIVLGYQTRILALVLAFYCLATAVFFHIALGDQNQMIHFLKNIAIAGGFLQLYAFGAGALSLDARREGAAA